MRWGFEYIFLKDVNLKLCQGCSRCMYLGEDKCPLEDDRVLIEENMLAADGVILSSPMHQRNVSGLMKNFIDRLAYTHGRPKFLRQNVMLVFNGLSTGIGKKETFKALRQAMHGVRIVHELHAMTPPYLEQEKMVRKKEEAIRAGAEKLFKACLDRRLSAPSIKDYLAFRISKAFLAGLKEDAPAYYEFYRGKEYYYDGRISSIARMAAWAIILLITRLLIKDYLPGDVKWPR